MLGRAPPSVTFIRPLKKDKLETKVLGPLVLPKSYCLVMSLSHYVIGICFHLASYVSIWLICKKRYVFIWKHWIDLNYHLVKYFPPCCLCWAGNYNTKWSLYKWLTNCAQFRERKQVPGDWLHYIHNVEENTHKKGVILLCSICPLLQRVIGNL